MAAATNGRPTGDYQERLMRFQATDEEKNEMINELITNLEDSRKECRQTSLDLERERIGCRSLQDQVQDLQGELGTLTNRRGFILVLIDADADDYIFHSKFLNRNDTGGKEAADELHARVKDHLRNLKIDVENTDIMVRAYANVKGLQVGCIKNGKMKSNNNVALFMHGFNQRQALFDFVDVGPGKEEADNKIRECLNFFVRNSQCKHIVLGVCHDSGYASSLGRFAADVSTRDRITLLEGDTINPRIRALGFRNILKLDTVFAPQTIQAVPVLPSTFVGAPSTQGLTNPAALSDRLGPVLRNESGQRVDKKLHIDPSTPYIHALRQAKMCAWYYLRGRCESNCDKNHFTPALKSKEFDFLWFIARHGLCFKMRKEKDCDDPLCVYGHEKGCPIGTGNIRASSTGL